jgi:hypothetical protein
VSYSPPVALSCILGIALTGVAMEALKFAFNILIIGALALPWLVVLLRMYSLPPVDGKAERHSALVSALPPHTRDTVLGVTILALGYFLGVAVSRVSDDFFGDPDLWSLPTASSIREDVYHHEFCDDEGGVLAAAKLPYELGKSKLLQFCHAKTPASSKRPYWRDDWGDAVTQFFRLEESKLLLQGDDKTTRLRELHDQSMILRGAALNGLVLSTLCFFGFCASFQGGFHNWRRFGSTYAAFALILYGGYRLYTHFQHFQGDQDYFRDPPLAEAIIVLVGIAGLLAKAREESRWKYAHGCGLSLALTIVAYGAWWWTEVMYNQGVIHAYPTL